MTEAVRTDILIVGAGLSGLMAATVLRRAGQQVVLLDKGRSVGGRLATRRVGEGVADHGAQFFTVRDEQFQNFVNDWIVNEDLVYVWSHGWSDGSTADNPQDGYPRYGVRGGMNALAKHLAIGLDIRLDVQIERVAYHNDEWTAQTADGDNYHAKALLLTPPVPQSLKLLENGGAALTAGDIAALSTIEYAPCLCGLFLVEGDIYLPEPGALQRPYAEIAWIADNQRKGISPNARVLTLHANHDFSRVNYEASDEALLERFAAELTQFMHPNAHIHDAQIKRWRYSQPTTLYPERCLQVEGLPLVFAGDAFGGPRVEGAALSGLAAAGALLSLVD
jgi:renalase